MNFLPPAERADLSRAKGVRRPEGSVPNYGTFYLGDLGVRPSDRIPHAKGAKAAKVSHFRFLLSQFLLFPPAAHRLPAHCSRRGEETEGAGKAESRNWES